MWKNKKIKTKEERTEYIIKWFILFVFATGGYNIIKDFSVIDPIDIISINYPKEEVKIAVISNIKRVSAYNVGIEAQTDSTPCFGARRHNLCEMLEQGINICACNSLELWTEIEIEGYGKCIVLDRMNSRYTNGEIDIAFPEDQIQEAKNWGIKYRDIKIIK